MAANVLIRKQKIRVRTSDEQLALQVRKLLNDTLQYDLKSMIERVFDRNAPSNSYINIDKLSIDLGTLSANNFEQEFIKQAESQLVNELQKQLWQYMEVVYPSDVQDHDFYNSKNSDTPFLGVNSVGEQEITAIIYFLEKGIYPWWFPKNEHKTPTEILDSLTEVGSENLLLKMIVIRKTKSVEIINRIIVRLFMYLPAIKYEWIISRLAEQYTYTALIENAEAVIKNIELLKSIFSLPEREIYKHLFRFLILNTDLATENFMIHFFKKIMADEMLSVDTIKNNQRVNTRPDTEIENIISNIIQHNGIESKKNSSGQPKEEGLKISKTNGLEPDEAIYINNAGLLLLHPFLQYLFSDSGLLADSNQFISITAQHKAAVLLYFLQSGRVDYKEWEMPLNKLLCGMGYQEVLPDNIRLSDSDKQNCNNLLKAVVDHWRALKSASIEALRNTFLLREGKISYKETHWLIQVERTGTDILLERLPWGYSTVKLPWLNQIILTEW